MTWRKSRWLGLSFLLPLTLGIIAASGARAQSANSLPAAWSHWKYFRAIDLSAASAERLVTVQVPEEVFARSSSRLADLRVIYDTGVEVPYLIEARYGADQRTQFPCRILETSFVPGKYSQIICDGGTSSVFHNAVYFETPEQNFMAWAQAAVSDDAREWRIVNEHSPVYHFPGRDLAGLRTLNYGDTNARYVRLRIFRTDKAFSVSSMMLMREVIEKKESVPVDARLSPDNGNFPGETVWRADLSGAGLPVDEISIETSQAEFSRRVNAESSSDGVNWSHCGSGDVYRFGQGQTLKESLRVGIVEEWTPYLRIRISNGNDQPLSALRVALYMTPRKLAFRQQPGRKYLLLYGQSAAKPPQYDIAQTLNAEQLSAAQPAQGVGAEEVNLAWSDPRPWSERHAAVLWVAAILAALLLALVALRSLRSTAPPDS